MGRAMSVPKDARAERLKAALRENLRRRKIQGRERAEGTPAPGEKQSRATGDDRNGPDSDKSSL
jgi:hypothetical protein